MAESFPPSSIQTSLFTHILYAFVEIDPSSYELTISQSDQILMTNFTSTLHSKSPPPPKLFLSIGGGGSNASAFATMSSNPTTRTKSIASTIKSARDHNFDGLDLDWEFPQTPGKMSNLATLLQEWRGEPPVGIHRHQSHNAPALHRRLLRLQLHPLAGGSFLRRRRGSQRCCSIKRATSVPDTGSGRGSGSGRQPSIVSG
ncbi:unnamed protein product [Linum tenue]|uniref:GH18 domain-containing protein n=1 Tax=Linum tenue TaxID=586396 RepID=A0AAV0LZR3_9ROSI|nr:unnamed protein product [Linum tenue]